MRQSEKRVSTADKATQVAVDFLKRYYSYTRPIRATKSDHIWVVEVDVGYFLEKIAKVHVDQDSASIIEYYIPKAEELPAVKT